MGFLLVVVLVCASCTQSSPAQISSPGQRLFPDDKTPTVISDPDTRPIEVGMQFTTSSDGVIAAVRFYQGPGNSADTATLWAVNGTKLATAHIPPGPDGWREIPFTDPVMVKADRVYVVSYHASQGHYSDDSDTFAGGRKVKSGWLTGRQIPR
jgi:hypothetical protein